MLQHCKCAFYNVATECCKKKEVMDWIDCNGKTLGAVRTNNNSKKNNGNNEHNIQN